VSPSFSSLRRALAILLAAGVGSGVLVGVPLGVPAAAAGDPEQELAERYAPRIHLVEQPEPCGVGEPFRPSDVEPLFGADSVALRGPWTQQDLIEVGPTAEDLRKPLRGYSLDFPGNPLRPGCTYEEWADRLWRGSPPTVYAHVATEAGKPGVALQYWMYYPYNDFNNKHEGDWERIQLEFDVDDVTAALETEPARAVFSQHEGAERLPWAAEGMQVTDGTHVAVYVSAGSHASRFSSGVYLLRSTSQGFGCDATLDAPTGLVPAVVTIPSDPAAAKAAYPWLAFRGTWGQREAVSFYSGPTGPSSKSQWTKPFTWSANADDTSYAVPGGSVYGVKTTTFFCSLVGKASVLLLRYNDDPVPTLLALAAVLVLVIWLVRRTSWDETEALPARRRRGLGRTASAAWRTYRAHPGLFLGIGSVVAAVSLVSGLLQQVLASAPGSEGGGSLTGVGAVVGLVGTLVLLGALVLSSSATVQALSELDAGRTPTVRRALALARPRYAPLVGTLLLAGLACVPLLLTLFLSPLVLLLLLAWALVTPVVQLEGISGIRALRRSWALVRPQWSKVVGVLLLGGLLLALLGGLAGTVVLLVAQVPFVLVNLVPGVVNALVGPFVSLMLGYAYFHTQAPAPQELEHAGSP
jgi:hypothetical protein